VPTKSKRKTAKRTKHARRITSHAAKVAADALARAKGHKIEDPEADTDEIESIEGAAPPPPLPTSDGPPTAPPAALVELGLPPADPLAAQEWLYRANILSAHDAMNDSTISAKERRRELRTISASASRLMPDARRWQAEQLILSNQKELEAKAKSKRGAKLEPAPVLTPAPEPIDDNPGEFGDGLGDRP
jgi:hypothetical protein